MPPDADPTSEENARRGQRAMQWANEREIDKRAEKVAAGGTLEEMVELINTVDRWANEALLSPEVSGIGDTRFKRTLNVLSDGFRGILDEYAATGNVEALRAARSTVDGVRNPELRVGPQARSAGVRAVDHGERAGILIELGWGCSMRA